MTINAGIALASPGTPYNANHVVTEGGLDDNLQSTVATFGDYTGTTASASLSYANY